MPIKKKKNQIVSSTGVKAAVADDDILRFSFKFFDATDVEVCPAEFQAGYTQTLMDRLKSLSSWRVSDFTGNRSRSIRSHPINWDKTSRPDGFVQLNEQYQAYTPYQFCLSANEYGRVHGFLIGSCFYVVWLDCNHAVYPG
ncbi:hypothetical protein [Cohaesibacter sp. ES.047]|uniref:hypothetical protein n=1 Tax=Cohaesibacter sp. ES.047 TaxID=1798205 RepID=UPI0018D5071F|nr:hypothetical protein [Cohaesibacter sp. ES.047]